MKRTLSLILALVMGIVISNFMPNLAESLKDACRPELFVKIAIVIMGAELGVKAADAAGFAGHIIFRGLCAIVEAYLLYWCVVYYVARRYFKFNREWAAPLASGISICGVSAAIEKGLVYAAAILTFAVLLFLIGYILVTGIPHLTPSLFSLHYTSENVSMIPAIVTTVEMTALALLLAVPLGLFTAIYLNEYAKRGNKLVGVIRVTTETLSGIPSIVYGLFGMLFFVTRLHWGYSLIAGAMTLAIMILPLIMRTAEEALMSVPDSFREGSFGLGAGRLRTVFRIVLPAAVPGILSGIILSIGRIVGETAALIFTAGTMAQIPGLTQSGRTLAIHMYVLSGEALHMNEANATAVVLLIVVLLMNALSAFAARKLTKK